MPDIEAMKAVTARGVASFATIETALESVTAAANDLIQVYKDGNALGMAKAGPVVAQISEFNRWVGMVGALQEMVYAAHAKSTAIAKANGADTEIPGTYATLARSDSTLTAMGGGDR